MTSEIVMTTLTNTDKRFYPLVGPFLADRAVHKALGGVPYDDDGKTWIVARRNARAVGIIALRTNRQGLVTAESCYTRPGHEDVRSDLIAAVIEQTHPSPVATTVRSEVAPAYHAAGFQEVKPVGKNFVHLVRKGNR